MTISNNLLNFLTMLQCLVKKLKNSRNAINAWKLPLNHVTNITSAKYVITPFKWGNKVKWGSIKFTNYIRFTSGDCVLKRYKKE